MDMRSVVRRAVEDVGVDGRHGTQADQAQHSGMLDTEVKLAMIAADMRRGRAEEEDLLSDEARFQREVLGRLCIDCGDEIHEARLRARPKTKICIRCAEMSPTLR